jgi:hypothetical protein
MQKVTSNLEKFEQSAPCNFAILQACNLQAYKHVLNLSKTNFVPVKNLLNGLSTSEMPSPKDPKKMFNGFLRSEMPVKNSS